MSLFFVWKPGNCLYECGDLHLIYETYFKLCFVVKRGIVLKYCNDIMTPLS